ncbi:hypothetical protein ACFRKD_26785 [Streptomyces niveus]|uniref:hypothetical protein n=1 Tax=Streptomyces niveus TaxID=193462 RepID=UPI0036A609C0
MTTLPLIRTAVEFEELRQAVSTVEIPAGFDRWHPSELTEWLDGAAEDEDVPEADFLRAQVAVFYALGVDPEDVQGNDFP